MAKTDKRKFPARIMAGMYYGELYWEDARSFDEDPGDHMVEYVRADLVKELK